ncbi:OmpA family protein [Pseudophaeobacter sp.]|uniref:OmpA family protein n=1 Tax=Pseudophaeobacter sp. TaxID=1971739 RepID=UPI00329776AC
MMHRLATLGLGFCLSLPLSPALAQSEVATAQGNAGLQMPAGTTLRSRRETALGTYALPVGPYSKAGIPQQLQEGHILRRTWQLQGDATVLQVVNVLRAQLLEQGYEILFQCESRQCGGFDFRFGIEVVPAPDMVVSLSDYHFLAAAGPVAAIPGTDADAERPQVSVLVSRSGTTNYIQVIEVSPPQTSPLAIIEAESKEPEPVAVAPETPDHGDFAELVLGQGHAVLDGVMFNTGAATLGEGATPGLEQLASFLAAEPTAKILIVGHTDSVGSLVKNQALSLERATVVKQRLVEGFAIDAARVEVAGAGFIAPIASNLTAEGRDKNRRVEVVLISKEP